MIDKNKSLNILNSEIINEWHPTKNGALKPENFTRGSNEKLWWQCEKGHEWEASPNSRLGRGISKCPYCVNQKVLRGYNDLATTHPELIKEWNFTKNTDLKPTNVIAGSTKKVWWICEHGHEWEASLAKRSGKDKRGCPYCANKKVLAGYNDLATHYPEIAKEWHPTKNGDLKPTDVTSGSNRKVWWKCEKGHEWEISPNNRQKSGCPYCSNKKILKGYNDLTTTNPDLIKEWHPVKNGDLKPENFTKGSSKSVWWICEKGHEWQTQISNRARGAESKCPYCANKKILAGYNDLTTTHPRIAKEWHPTKNGALKPENIIAGNDKKVWWQCDKGHEWKTSTRNRTTVNGTDCPYCYGRYVIPGQNDLATRYPDIAKEWHPTKNGDLKPIDIVSGSGKKFWWQCEKGHEWEATASSRTSNGSNCPYCMNQEVLKGFNDLATYYPDIAKEWHPNKNGDLKPSDVMYSSTKKVWWQCEKGHEWKTVIGNRTGSSKTGCPYCSNRYLWKGYNDLVTKYPDIAKEWHSEKNNDLKPDEVIPGSPKKVWWKCNKGHEWKATISSRTGVSKTGCPHCVKYKRVSFPEKAIYFYIKKVFKDAIENYKEKSFGRFELDIYIPSLKLAIEYDGQRFHTLKNLKKDEEKNILCENNNILLIRVRESKCATLKENNNVIILEQDTRSIERLNNNIKYIFDIIKEKYNVNLEIDFNINCDDDRGEIIKLMNISEYEQSLENSYPEISKQWHPAKNGELKPSQVSKSANIHVWWKCEKGHEWKALVSSRTRKIGKSGCPYCANQKVLEGYNDLATTHPELIKEWDFTKNIDLKPTNVIAGSSKKVWWQCDKGHQWEASLAKRSGKDKRGCPYCSNHKVLVGYNDLATYYPEIANEWHPTKNEDLKPTDVTPYSGKNIWWKSKDGDEWQAKIISRTRGKISTCSSN